MEAGNLGVDPADGIGYGFPEVRLLTTSREYPQTPFEHFGETSAAAANAARLCAIVRSQYPELWPETVRALIVDSANWTSAMLDHLPANPTKKIMPFCLSDTASVCQSLSEQSTAPAMP